MRTQGWRLGLVLVAAVFASACSQQNKVIEKVTFKPSENLEVMRVSVVFSKKIQSDLTGGFAIKNYGYLFVNPYTEKQPFEVGFDLNTSVFNEQDYIRLTPTTVFPNGVPMGLPHAVVQINSTTPISPHFDLYGYVDVLETSWLGAASILNFVDEQYFPPGLAVSMVFLRNDEGKPGMIASAFGPETTTDGAITRAGGLAVLANIRQLIAQNPTGKEMVFYPEPKLHFSGRDAAKYEAHPELLLKYQDKIIERMNAQP